MGHVCRVFDKILTLLHHDQIRQVAPRLSFARTLFNGHPRLGALDCVDSWNLHPDG